MERDGSKGSMLTIYYHMKGKKMSSRGGPQMGENRPTFLFTFPPASYIIIGLNFMISPFLWGGQKE